MKKFNIIIAFRDRTKQLRSCLNNLDIAAEKYDVNVTLISDKSFSFEKNEYYNNLNTSFYQVSRKYIPFNKSYLLNYGLKLMRKNFDYVSVIDADMVYNTNFFKIIENLQDNTFCISNGYKLTQKETDYILDNEIKFDDIKALTQKTDTKNGANYRNTKHAVIFPSQITLSKNLYKILVDILGSDKLYCEKFIGWGGEDTLIFKFLQECANAGICKGKYGYDIWYHLNHKPAPVDRLMKANFKLLKKLIIEMEDMIRKYNAKQ
jgi:hypothetical protein